MVTIRYVPIAQDDDEVDDDENDLLLSELGSSSGPSFGEQSLAQILLEESKTDWSTIGVLSCCWVLILLSSLMKGGEGAASLVGVQCGTFSYWSIFIAVIPVFLLLTVSEKGEEWELEGRSGSGRKADLKEQYATGKRLHARWLRKKDLFFKFHKGDVEWNGRNVILYPLMCTTAGIAAGLLGIGGGMVKGPLMLAMHIEPQVASATSAFMILFTSSSTTVQFIILGALQADYALWYACWGFVATYVGQIVINHYVKKHRKTSYIVISIAVVVGLSCLFMTFDGGWNIVRKVKRQKYMGFKELCS